MLLETQYCAKHTTTRLESYPTVSDPAGLHLKCRECLSEIAVEAMEEQERLNFTLESTDKYTNTPQYYNTSIGDLYDFFIAHFGIEEWRRHALLEAIQYLVRAERKGSFKEDLVKAKVIIERILKESE